MGGDLEATLFIRQRVLKISTYHTVFIRCRSFQNTSKHGGVGYAIAFSMDSGQSWKLGMLAYSHVQLLTKSKVLVYEWKGEVLTSNEKAKQPGIPKYCFSDSKSWKNHFKLKCIDIHKRNIYFLNQVSGRRINNCALSLGLINVNDGGYQSSKSSPYWLLPGFPFTINSNLREEVLGYSLWYSCPPVMPAKPHKKTRKRNRCKRHRKTNIVG